MHSQQRRKHPSQAMHAGVPREQKRAQRNRGPKYSPTRATRRLPHKTRGDTNQPNHCTDMKYGIGRGPPNNLEIGFEQAGPVIGHARCFEQLMGKQKDNANDGGDGADTANRCCRRRQHSAEQHKKNPSTRRLKQCNERQGSGGHRCRVRTHSGLPAYECPAATENVSAPDIRWLSSPMTRYVTVYVPAANFGRATVIVRAAARGNGTSLVAAFSPDFRMLSAVIFADSLNVSRICVGATVIVLPFAGIDWVSFACANASPGNNISAAVRVVRKDFVCMIMRNDATRCGRKSLSETPCGKEFVLRWQRSRRCDPCCLSN